LKQKLKFFSFISDRSLEREKKSKNGKPLSLELKSCQKIEAYFIENEKAFNNNILAKKMNKIYQKCFENFRVCRIVFGMVMYI